MDTANKNVEGYLTGSYRESFASQRHVSYRFTSYFTPETLF